VRVVLGGRRVGGWVAELDVEPPRGVDLQPVAKLSGLGPPPSLVALADWAAWRWAGPVTAFLRAASPDRVVRRLPRQSFAWKTGGGRTGRVAVPEAELVRADRGRPVVFRLPPSQPLLVDVLSDLVTAVLGESGAITTPTDEPGVLILTPSVAGAERLAVALDNRAMAVTRRWEEAAAGWPVVVGSRAAAWAPLPRLAAAIVLDAHDEAYRQEGAPTWSAPDVVAERARRDGAPAIFVTPCPTVVQWERSDHLVLGRAAERGGWPVLSIVDRRGADPRTGLFSEELVRLARGSEPAPEQPFVAVLNRTGRARLLACRACGELARCEHCGRPVEQADDVLRCRSCGKERPVVCAACGAPSMKVLRPGVTRVREELEALLRLPVAEVVGPAAEVPAVPVLVGTEAVLHRVRRAAAVAFLDFDQHLLAPRFSAPEEALALLARAGRLVGARASDGRTVLVQTRLPDHEVLVAALHGDPGRLVDHELEFRRRLALPPAAALALVSGPAAEEFAGALAGAEVNALGDGRWLARAPDSAALCDALAATPRPRGRLRVEVDPTGV